MRHKLLLADDSETIQRVIEMTFADEPVDVATVSDGEAAIARLAIDPPDIVLADIGMPGRDGYEVAMRVRQTPALAHIPVVLLTGAFDPVDYARAREAGCAGVLVKPFDPQMLIARVRQLLHAAQAATPQAQVAARPGLADGTSPAESLQPPPQPQAASVETRPSFSAQSPTAKVDEYFARLDRAFARLEAGTFVVTAGADLQTPASEPTVGRRTTPDAGDAADVERAVQAHAVPTGDVTHPEQSDPRVAPANADASLTAHPATAPTLADAFLALLTMESGNAAPAGAGVGGSELLEEIATRVSREVAERVVRELAPDIVSQIAERVVREEIARMTAALG